MSSRGERDGEEDDGGIRRAAVRTRGQWRDGRVVYLVSPEASPVPTFLRLFALSSRLVRAREMSLFLHGYGC